MHCNSGLNMLRSRISQGCTLISYTFQQNKHLRKTVTNILLLLAVHRFSAYIIT